MSDPRSQSIAVLALNPAVDISYEIPQLIADQKVRASRTYYHPGGNGINVARGITGLGIPVHCCSVIGGESGDLLLRLLGDALGENHRYFRVPGETRLNATLLQQHPPSQYEVDSLGPEVSPEVLEELTECFVSRCGDGIGVLTGSVPPSVPNDLFAILAERIQAQGGKAVVDAHGRVLHQALEAKPNLVRLNRYVLEMTVKRRLGSAEEVAEAARVLHQQHGIGSLCVTLGSEGALLLDNRNSYLCTAPKVRVHSTVGCGDALVAGLVAAAHRGADSQAMLRFGVICGSATASHPGTELFTRDEVEKAAYDVELSSLEV
jgi:6-phosphofructokinase 2